jgi:hypothetical protein
MRRTKRTLTQAEKEIYLREALGLKKVVRDGRVEWVKDKSIKEPKLQFGAGVQFK